MNKGETLFNNARISAQLIINTALLKTPQVIRNAVNEICSLQAYKDIDRNKLILRLEKEKC